MLASLLSAKVAALAAAAALLLGGGVAAAAGVLPAPVQSAVSHGLSDVGVSVPAPNSHASARAKAVGTALGHDGSAAGGTTAGGSTPPATSASTFGLCNAFASSTAGSSSSQGSANGVAFERLAALAKSHGESVQQFCAGVKAPSDTTEPSLPSQAGGHPSATEPSLPSQAGGHPSTTEPSLPSQAGGSPSGTEPSLPSQAGGSPSGSSASGHTR